MKLKPISFLSPEENIYFDEVLFDLAEQGKGGEVLRFWESMSPFIVLGRTSKEDQDLVRENVIADRIPVIRRFSAGGTVVQGKGCLNFTCLLEKGRWSNLATISGSYHFILGRICEALEKLDVRAHFYPPCDLALKENDRKFSGNAQRRGKRFILHHGTILYGFDIALAQKYLSFPVKTPDYRKDRGHSAFMVNIDRNPEDIERCLSAVFQAKDAEKHLSELEEAVLGDIILRKRVNTVDRG